VEDLHYQNKLAIELVIARCVGGRK
jgi:hypothetical protein